LQKKKKKKKNPPTTPQQKNNPQNNSKQKKKEKVFESCGCMKYAAENIYKLIFAINILLIYKN